MLIFRSTIILAAGILLTACSDSGRIGEWRKAEIREACFGETSRTHRSWARLPENRIGLLTAQRGEMMATALNCYIVLNKQAVCEKHNRAYIVDYVTRYFSFKRGTYKTAEEYGERERKVVDQFWRNNGDDRIVYALADHIENGRLNSGDFGWFAPDELKQILAQFKGVHDKCATEVAWQAPTPKNHIPTFDQSTKGVRR